MCGGVLHPPSLPASSCREMVASKVARQPWLVALGVIAAIGVVAGVIALAVVQVRQAPHVCCSDGLHSRHAAGGTRACFGSKQITGHSKLVTRYNKTMNLLQLYNKTAARVTAPKWSVEVLPPVLQPTTNGIDVPLPDIAGFASMYFDVFHQHITCLASAYQHGPFCTTLPTCINPLGLAINHACLSVSSPRQTMQLLLQEALVPSRQQRRASHQTRRAPPSADTLQPTPQICLTLRQNALWTSGSRSHLG